ncbi:hypothetical protein H8B08_04010, partial [Caulobacter sp. 17J80-11]|nr:hypothetical protein [Caulobacter sp. 17J80-11]
MQPPSDRKPPANPFERRSPWGRMPHSMTEPLAGGAVTVAPGDPAKPAQPATAPAAQVPKRAARAGAAAPVAEAPPPKPLVRPSAQTRPAAPAEASQSVQQANGRARHDVGTARPALFVPTPPRGHPPSTGAILRQSLAPPPEPPAKPAPAKSEPAVSPASLEAKSRRFAGEFLTAPSSRPARPQAAPRPAAEAV